MTYSSLLSDGVFQRVYSSFDGRIYATRNDETKSINFSAYSWSEVKKFDSILESAKWLLDEAYKRAKYFDDMKRKS